MSYVRLVLYSKPGCHLCEGLQEKLEQIQRFDLKLEVRDITTRDDWFQAYQYEVPVLFLDRGLDTAEVEEVEEYATLIQDTELPPSASLIPLPRPSPRATVQQLEQMLQKYLPGNRRE
jgi:Glutaredoxin-like domain (DUF836).